MKQLGAIIFLCCFILLTFSNSFTMLSFYLNQDVIIAKFCVNKSRPKLHCNGHCFLAKKIKEQEKSEAGTALMASVKIEVVSSRSFYANPLNALYKTIVVHEAVYINDMSPQAFTTNIFKPPVA